MIYARLFLRGFLIVGLVALNTRQVAQGRYVHAGIVGFLISGVWWFNSRTAAHERAAGGWIAYASGASLGTVVGMWLGR